MGLGFDVRRVVEGGEGFAGDGANGGELAVLGKWDVHGKEVFGGAAAGEGDVVGSFFFEDFASAGGVFGFGDGLVGDADIDDGVEGVESVGDDHAGFLGFDPKHGKAIDLLFLEGVDEAFGDVLVGDEVDGEAVFVNLGDGGGSDGRDFGSAKAAGVFVDGVEAFKESLDAVGAGEDEPVIGVGVADELGEVAGVVGVLDADGGQFDDVGSEVAELFAELAGLFAGAGDDDTFAKEGAAFEPVDFLALFDDVPDDGHGWGLKAFAFGDVGDVGEGAGDGAVSAGGGPASEGDGGIGFSAVFDEFAGDFAKASDAHDEDFGAGGIGELGVVEGGFFFGGVFVTGEDGELGIVCAMSDWDASVGGAADGGGDAGHDFEGDAGFGEFGGFFASTPENHGVAAFESADGLSFEGFLNDEGVDLVLGDGVVFGALASKDFFATRLGPVEEFGATEGVVDEDVAGLDALFGFDGGQSDVTRASADEIANSFHMRRTLAEMWGIFNRFDACVF